MPGESGVLFPTSVVGSMPRPSFVRELVACAEEMPGGLYERHMSSAVHYVAALQEQAGLDVVTDGEWRRRSYIGVIAELAHGFELSHTQDGRPMTVVVDELSPKDPGFIAREIRYLKQITGKQVKATLPAPALLGQRMWDPGKSAKSYSSREDFVRACVPILRHEIELLLRDGVDIVQIDDPHLCLFVDAEVRAGYEDPDAAADFSVDTVNQLVDGFGAGEAGARLAVHLCRRAGARARGDLLHAGSYELILDQLNRLSVDHLTMEYATPAAGDMTVFRQLREDFEIGLGCVSCTPGEVDSVETIVERVESACQHLDPGRITLNPDCGFAPGSAANVSLDEVYQKLKNEVEAAHRLRDRYG